jgi:mono/diheme cytochrome c family protein
MRIRTIGSGLLGVLSTLVLAPLAAGADEKPAKPAEQAEAVSFYKQVRPIFQAHCQGCHQPAKAGGGFVMTDFDRLLAGGESKLAAIVPKDADESHLIEMITPDDGEAEMPKGKPPLGAEEIKLVKRWIIEGAVDDTPPNTRQRYDRDHPPIYTRPPVITALEFSPDGTLLAVAGFHEV